MTAEECRCTISMCTGYEDCFYGEGVTLIEWSNMIEEILPEHVKTVTIEKNLEKGFDYRKITVEEK